MIRYDAPEKNEAPYLSFSLTDIYQYLTNVGATNIQVYSTVKKSSNEIIFATDELTFDGYLPAVGVSELPLSMHSTISYQMGIDTHSVAGSVILEQTSDNGYIVLDFACKEF